MKLVAVSQRVDVIAGRGEQRDALDQRIAMWLMAAGFLAVPIPNRFAAATPESDGTQHWMDAVNPAAIVLSGGNDVGEFAERDATEHALLNRAAARGIPVLGICRGMQMICVWAGGALKTVAHHVRTHHQLRGTIQGAANSFHNLAPVQCPPAFEVLAQAEDGGIEAFRHRTLPIEGWMWHPEREPVFLDRDLERLQSLFR